MASHFASLWNSGLGTTQRLWDSVREMHICARSYPKSGSQISSQITFTKPIDMHRRQKDLVTRFATAKRRNNEAVCYLVMDENFSLKLPELRKTGQ